MTAKAPDASSLTERSIIMKWLMQQGVPSVLLCGIMIGGWYTATYQAPDWIDKIITGFDKVVTKVSDTYEKDQIRDENRYQQLQRTLEDVVRGRQPIVNHKPAALHAPL